MTPEPALTRKESGGRGEVGGTRGGGHKVRRWGGKGARRKGEGYQAGSGGCRVRKSRGRWESPFEEPPEAHIHTWLRGACMHAHMTRGGPHTYMATGGPHTYMATGGLNAYMATGGLHACLYAWLGGPARMTRGACTHACTHS